MPGKAPSPRAVKEAAEAAGKAVGEEEEGNESQTPLEIALASGIVLKLKPVPPFLVRAAVTKLKKPEIPVTENEDKGRREPNPGHPAYLDSMEEYEAATIETGTNVLLIAGTEVIHVPEGCFGPDDDGWKDLASYFEIGVETENSKTNYLNYLKWYALASAEDLTAVLGPLMELAGLTEEEVKKAAAGFRNRAERRAHNGISDQDN